MQHQVRRSAAQIGDHRLQRRPIPVNVRHHRDPNRLSLHNLEAYLNRAFPQKLSNERVDWVAFRLDSPP
jgi:hypothetical protein